ncbi:MAG: hypothetical protein WHU94_13890 [Thermogemmata sp.]|jgi:hypothetical protein|nr:MAG: hypothetical protein KatS3mg082_2445 [Nitrospiraceae bacterium]
MKQQQILALIKKELRETVRSSPLPILLSPGLAVAMQFLMLRRLEREGAGILAGLGVNEAAAASLMFTGPVVIPFLAMSMMQRRFIREQLLGSLVPVLCTGVRIGDIWLAKVLSSFLVGYGAALVALAANTVLIKLYLEEAVVWSGALLAVVLVVSPMGCLMVVGVMGLLVFAIRTTAFAGFLPLLILMGLQVFWHKLVTRPVLLSGVYLAVVGAVVTLALVYQGVNRLSKQYFLKV